MPLRILVVDDYEPFRRYLCSTLEQEAAFRVVGQASDGLEAIQKAEELQPDLILLDIGLPGLNGLQVAARVPEIAPLARILYISQEPSVDIVEAALGSGALGYIQKIRVQSELLPAIATVVQGRYFVSGVFKARLKQAIQNKSLIRHEVQLYSDDAFLLESFTDFVAAALKSGKSAILVAIESHRAGILQGLKTKKFDVVNAIKKELLVPLDVPEALSLQFMCKEMADPSRLCDVASGLIEAAANAADREQVPRVAVCRECPPRLFAESKMAEALQFEQLWDKIAHTSNVDLLCGYAVPISEKHDSIFQSICAEHSAVYSW